MTDQRKGGRPKGGRRTTDPILDLSTHRAKFVSLSQLSDYWKAHTQTLLKFVHTGKLRAYRLGSEYRVKREDALDFESTCLFKKRTAS